MIFNQRSQVPKQMTDLQGCAKRLGRSIREIRYDQCSRTNSHPTERIIPHKSTPVFPNHKMIVGDTDHQENLIRTKCFFPQTQFPVYLNRQFIPIIKLFTSEANGKQHVRPNKRTVRKNFNEGVEEILLRSRDLRKKISRKGIGKNKDTSSIISSCSSSSSSSSSSSTILFCFALLEEAMGESLRPTTSKRWGGKRLGSEKRRRR